MRMIIFLLKGSLKATAALVACLLVIPAYVRGEVASSTVRYSYDEAGRLTTAVYDDAAAIAYQYDLNGNRTRKVVAGPDNPNSDADGNGIYDLWELRYFQTLGIDPNDDPDGDDMNNQAESRAWTNPTNDASYLAMVSISNVVDDVALRWAETHSNAVYRLWWTDNLTNWNSTNSALIGAGVGTYLYAAPANMTMRFFRVSAEP